MIVGMISYEHAIALVGCFLLVTIWTAVDAGSRGRPRLASLATGLIVALSPPLGLIVWLIKQPPKLPSATSPLLRYQRATESLAVRVFARLILAGSAAVVICDLLFDRKTETYWACIVAVLVSPLCSRHKLDEDLGWPDDGSRADYFLRAVVIFAAFSVPVGVVVQALEPTFALVFYVLWGAALAVVILYGFVRWLNCRAANLSRDPPDDRESPTNSFPFDKKNCRRDLANLADGMTKPYTPGSLSAWGPGEPMVVQRCQVGKPDLHFGGIDDSKDQGGDGPQGWAGWGPG
jgi:hypothetical protein